VFLHPNPKTRSYTRIPKPDPTPKPQNPIPEPLKPAPESRNAEPLTPHPTLSYLESLTMIPTPQSPTPETYIQVLRNLAVWKVDASQPELAQVISALTEALEQRQQTRGALLHPAPHPHLQIFDPSPSSSNPEP